MDDLKSLLAKYKNDELTDSEVVEQLAAFGIIEAGYAKLDKCRTERKGFPEIVFGKSKSVDLIKQIISATLPTVHPVVASKVDAGKGQELAEFFPNSKYYEEGLVFLANVEHQKLAVPLNAPVSVLSAGSSDAPIAEEAALLLEIIGYPVERIYDIGVAGIHRLFNAQDKIRDSSLCIVVAGMDGVLPSVAAGIFPTPVIAVPTSVGYGAHFQGLSSLLTMLNSCVPGVLVVNIDNGLGAALGAHSIFRWLFRPDHI
jgi:hypothetical protein